MNDYKVSMFKILDEYEASIGIGLFFFFPFPERWRKIGETRVVAKM